MRKIFAMLWLLSAAAVMLSAQSTIRVDAPNMVSADEQFNVTFIVEGENSPSDFSWSPGDDFQLVWGPQKGTSTSISIVNGKRTKSSQTTYTYVLLPKREGTFHLQEASAVVKGETLRSRSTAIEVVASGASRQGASGTQRSGESGAATGDISEEDLFLRMTLSRTSVVVGEPVTATLRLYQRVSIAGFEDAKFPSFNGFWSQEVVAPTNIEFHRENYNGGIYNVATLRSWTLIPQQGGTLAIDPSELVCLVNVRVASSPSMSIFDSFFQDEYRTIRKRISTSAQSVHVSALPGGAPASFGGGVGSFSIAAALSKDSLKTHDAASLKVTVSGRGNVSLLEAPKVSFPPDFELYDVKTTESVDAATKTSGSKTFEYPFIPRSYGEFVIPAVSYSYYDVDSHRYVTVTTDAIPLTVEKGAASDAPSSGQLVASVNRKDVRSVGDDIRFIATKTPSFKGSGLGFAFSGLFWGLSGLLVLLALAGFVLWKRSDERRSDVAGSKNRRATALARKKLALAGDFLAKDLYSAFYEELHKALLGFVGDKLNMDLADMSKDNIAASLQGRGVPEALSADFVGLLDACEYARYAPSSGHDQMDAHYQRALQVISAMDASMKAAGRTSGAGRAALLALLLLVPGLSRAAADYPDSLWNAGVVAYQDGRWADARDAWSQIEALGVASVDLYYNIGNSAFKQDDIAHAILYYERALKLDPSASDARYNLEFANSMIQDRIESVPEFFLSQWLRSLNHTLSGDAWAWLFLLFFGGALACVVVYLRASRPSSRKLGFWLGLACVLLALFAFCSAHRQWSDYRDATDAIVTRAVTSVKSSPGAESAKDLFILHEGTKVKILDQVGEWDNIQLSDGRQGWLQASDREII